MEPAGWICPVCGSNERTELVDGSIACAECQAEDDAAVHEQVEWLQGVHSQREFHHRPKASQDSSQQVQRTAAATQTPSEAAEERLHALLLVLQLQCKDLADDLRRRREILGACKRLFLGFCAHTDPVARAKARLPQASRQVSAEIRAQIRANLPPPTSLAILVLALQSLREPVTPADAIWWASQNFICFLSPGRDSRLSRTQSQIADGLRPATLPSADHVRLIMACVLSEASAEAPPADIPSLVSRYARELGLPVTVERAALRVSRIVDSCFALDFGEGGDGHKTGVKASLGDQPEGRAVARVIVAARLCFCVGVRPLGHDSDEEVHWSRFFCRHADHCLERILERGQEERWKGTKVPWSSDEVLHMQPENLHDYMQFTLRSFQPEAAAEPLRELVDPLRRVVETGHGARGNTKGRDEQVKEVENEFTGPEVERQESDEDDDEGEHLSADSSAREHVERQEEGIKKSLGEKQRRPNNRGRNWYAQVVLDRHGQRHETVHHLDGLTALRVFLRQFCLVGYKYVDRQLSGLVEQREKAHVEKAASFLEKGQWGQRKLLWYRSCVIRYGVSRWDGTEPQTAKEQAFLERGLNSNAEGHSRGAKRKRRRRREFEEPKMDLKKFCAPAAENGSSTPLPHRGEGASSGHWLLLGDAGFLTLDSHVDPTRAPQVLQDLLEACSRITGIGWRASFLFVLLNCDAGWNKENGGLYGVSYPLLLLPLGAQSLAALVRSCESDLHRWEGKMESFLREEGDIDVATTGSESSL